MAADSRPRAGSSGARPRGAEDRGSSERPRVGVISLGCPKNLVDTEVMLGLLQEAGFAPVPDLASADVMVVNTCCFVEAAREEARAALREAAEWRRAGGKALICAGCWPEMDVGGLRQHFPEIDAYMGPGDVPRIASVVVDALGGTADGPPGARRTPWLYDERTPRLQATPPWTAYVKIAEGCSHRCRFCVIPRLRGRYRSRPIASVVREAEQLAARGVREINLVAQDTTAYGAGGGDGDITQLLSALARIEQLHWIRLLYGFPNRVNERLIEVMAQEPRLCEYIDIPFQHAHRDVLRRMGRPGDGESYLRLIGRLREAMPDIAVRTTFLVGFPGESDEEFRTLLEFVEAADLDRAGVFCYSAEAGTPAAEMAGQVSPEEAKRRRHEIMALQQRISLARNRRWLGREMDVLIEGRREGPGEWVGRSFRDAPEIDGSVVVRPLGERPAPGDLVRARIIAAEPYDLVAEPAAASRRDCPRTSAAAKASRPSRRALGRGRRR